MQLSADSEHMDRSSEDDNERSHFYRNYAAEILPRGTIQTREYLREIGIMDEMQKIDLYTRAETHKVEREFEKLNVENPINKVD